MIVNDNEMKDCTLQLRALLVDLIGRAGSLQTEEHKGYRY